MLIFEKSRPGRGCSAIPACDVEQYTLPDEDMRESDLHLPEMAEVDLSRHYTELAKKAGVHKKILERHRKYIIAAAEILNGEYPLLAEYMNYIRKALDP